MSLMKIIRRHKNIDWTLTGSGNLFQLTLSCLTPDVLWASMDGSENLAVSRISPPHGNNYLQATDAAVSALSLLVESVMTPVLCMELFSYRKVQV